MPCKHKAQTCGPCRKGYKGLVGDVNAVCKKPIKMYLQGSRSSVTDLEVKQANTRALRLHLGLLETREELETGDECTQDDQCVYNLCDDNGFCSSPSKTCESEEPKSVCSGHGNCFFVDVSGKPVNECLGWYQLLKIYFEAITSNV